MGKLTAAVRRWGKLSVWDKFSVLKVNFGEILIMT